MNKRSASVRGVQGLSDLAWTENSRKIATASDDKLIKIFDVETVSSRAGVGVWWLLLGPWSPVMLGGVALSSAG